VNGLSATLQYFPIMFKINFVIKNIASTAFSICAGINGRIDIRCLVPRG